MARRLATSRSRVRARRLRAAWPALDARSVCLACPAVQWQCLAKAVLGGSELSRHHPCASPVPPALRSARASADRQQAGRSVRLHLSLYAGGRRLPVIRPFPDEPVLTGVCRSFNLKRWERPQRGFLQHGWAKRVALSLGIGRRPFMRVTEAFGSSPGIAGFSGEF